MQKFIVLALVIILASCQGKKQTTPIDLKFADQEQVVNCVEQNNALLNEALYSFEADIIRNYDAEKERASNAYARFIMPGLNGSAEYERLPSEHSKTILARLIKEGIINKNSTGKSSTNYEHPAVICIINNIEDSDLKRTINALIQTNSMDPALLDTRLRNKGRQIARQRYVAMYLALDAYFQRLAKVDFTPAPAQ